MINVHPYAHKADCMAPFSRDLKIESRIPFRDFYYWTNFSLFQRPMNLTFPSVWIAQPELSDT